MSEGTRGLAEVIEKEKQETESRRLNNEVQNGNIEAQKENLSLSLRRGQAERLEQARRNLDCMSRFITNLSGHLGEALSRDYSVSIEKAVKSNLTILKESVPSPYSEVTKNSEK